MTIEQKNELVKNYIISMCDNINKQYENILPKDKIDRAIKMFSNLEKNYDEIIEDINKLTQQTIDNYLKLFRQGKNSANEQPQQNTEERDSRTFE